MVDTILDDLEPSFSLNELDVLDPEKKPVTGAAVKNTAALAGMKSDDALNNALQIQQEYVEEGTSTTRQFVDERSEARQSQQLQAALTSILADPNIGFEEKRIAFESAKTVDVSAKNDWSVVATRMLEKDVPSSSLEDEEVRIDIAGALDEVDDWERLKQQTLTNQIAGLNSDGWKGVKDVITSFLPYVFEINMDDVAENLIERNILTEEDHTIFLDLGGNSKAMTGALERMPLKEREKFLQGAIAAIEDEKGVFLAGDNDFLAFNQLRYMLEEGSYTDTDYWVDTSLAGLDVILSAIGLSSPIKTAARSLKGIGEVSVSESKSMFQRMRQKVIQGEAIPQSPASITSQTNPDSARDFNSAATSDESGKVAESIYGTPKGDALTQDVMPDPLNANNIVDRAPSYIDSKVNDIDNVARDQSFIGLSDAEIATARATVIDRFTTKPAKQGLHYRAKTSQVGNTTDDVGSMNIRAVYGASADSGFGTADAARSRISAYASNLGIEDSNITILRRNNKGEYTPDLKKEGRGDYVVQVDYDYKLSTGDVDYNNEDIVRAHWLDQYVGLFNGKATSWFKNASATFDPRITLSAERAEVRVTAVENQLNKGIEAFTDDFSKLSESEAGRVDSYIKESNLRATPFDRKELQADNYSPQAIETIRKFREHQDVLYLLNNKSTARQLGDDGYEIVKNEAGDRFIGKEFTPSTWASRAEDTPSVQVYDVDAQTTKTVNTHGKSFQDVMDELNLQNLDADRSVKGLVSPVSIKNKEGAGSLPIDVIISSRSQGRRVKDTDIVTPYRDGYYHVRYKEPIFIDKVTTVKGKTRKETVGVSNTVVKANAQADNMRASAKKAEDNVEYVVRSDVKDANDIRRTYSSLEANRRQYMQYRRGERLDDFSAASDAVTQAEHIEDPLNSMIRSSRGLARRIAMTDQLNVMKKRFMQLYGHIVSPTSNGKLSYPHDVNQIKGAGQIDFKNAASSTEAKVMWEYIDHLERVRMTTTESWWRYGWIQVAEKFGTKGYGNTEKMARLFSKATPGSTFKSFTFNAFVVLNPLRQISLAVIEPLRTVGINPSNLLLIPRDLGALTMIKLGQDRIAAQVFRIDPKQYKKLLKEFEETGLTANIGKQQMVRAGIRDNVDLIDGHILNPRGAAKVLEKGKAAGSTALNAVSVSGFGVNEGTAHLTVWLAMRRQKVSDILAKEGKVRDLTKRELEEVAGRTQNFNYSQNRAGEFGYSKSVLSISAQFFHIPHTAALMVLPQKLGGSRALAGKEKAKFAASIALIYGAAPFAIFDSLTSKIENEKVRNTTEHGLLWLSFFNALDASVDTKAFSPLDTQGILEKMQALITGGNPFAPSAFAQAFAPRVQEAWATLNGVLSGETVADLSTPEKFGLVTEKFAEIAGGYSNYTKAKYAFEHGKFTSKKGWVTDNHVNQSEAWFKLFGVQSLDEVEAFKARNMLNKKVGAVRGDVESWYNQFKIITRAQGIPLEEKLNKSQTMSMFWMAHKDNPGALEHLNTLIERDVVQGDEEFALQILRSIDFVDPSELRTIIMESGMSPDLIEDLLGAIDDIMNRDNFVLDLEGVE